MSDGSLDTTPTCISSLRESSHRDSVVAPREDPVLAEGASSKQQGPGGVSGSSLSDAMETGYPPAGGPRGAPRLLVRGFTCISVGLHGVGGALEAFGPAHGAAFVGLHVGKRRFLKKRGGANAGSLPQHAAQLSPPRAHVSLRPHV